jgi:hypothetical protein
MPPPGNHCQRRGSEDDAEFARAAGHCPKKVAFGARPEVTDPRRIPRLMGTDWRWIQVH